MFPLQVAGRHPAVYQQCGPGDELSLVAGVEHCRGGHVVSLAMSLPSAWLPLTPTAGRNKQAGHAN